jgi:apolipoprotein D and lipocalin family protein
LNTIFLLVIPLLVAVTSNPQKDSSRKLDVVPNVDLHRYMGTWYEIARLPNRFQKQCAGDVTATYTLLENGDIKVVNRCRKADGEIAEAEGRAKLADKKGPNTKLKVRFAPAFLGFLPFVWGDYWIIELAPDYSYAVIGEPSRKYLWILSHTLEMDKETFDQVLEDVKNKGYDLTDLIKTKQSEK